MFEDKMYDLIDENEINQIKQIKKYIETPLIFDDVFSDEEMFYLYQDALDTEKWGYNVTEYQQGLTGGIMGSRYWGWTFFNSKTNYYGDDTPQWVLDLLPFLSKHRLPAELNLIEKK